MTTEVLYHDPTHTYYTMRNGVKKIYLSATTFLKHFYEQFDAESRSIAYAEKHGQTPQYWQDVWRKNGDDAAEYGTSQHELEERSLYRARARNGLTVHEQSTYNHCIDYYNELPDGVYPELKLWHHSWHIAGRADDVTIWTDKAGDRFMDIADHKTNKELQMRGYLYERGHRAGTRKMMYKPIQHIEDCKYNHYVLQLSLYQFMGEHLGFLPGKRTINHIPKYGQHSIHTIPYWRKEVQYMITHAVKNKILIP